MRTLTAARASILLLPLLLGCPPEDSGFTTCPASEDADGDGVCPPGDCDDNDAAINPGADELCNGLDDDCDGDLMESEVRDADGDGSVACEDCDDNDPLLSPLQEELCDEADNNCDGIPGEDEYDNDGDGHIACNECDDTNADVFPGAVEQECNGLDDDCDGVLFVREDDPDDDGFSDCDGDCDPLDPDRYPGAPELCNGLDDDCINGLRADETDEDGDGSALCDGDCNDDEASIRPGNVEQCDGIDSDCDPTTFWVDTNTGESEGIDEDGDGWPTCLGDCDDLVATTNPEAYDIIGTAVDANCDGTPGGQQPGFESVGGTLGALLTELEIECQLHGKTRANAPLDLGPDGALVGTASNFVTFSSLSAAGAVDVIYSAGDGDVAPPNSPFMAATAAPVSSVSLVFGTLQTMVVADFAGYDEATPDDYTASLVDGGTVVTAGPVFGSDVPDPDWTLRGYVSLRNAGFNELTLAVGTGERPLYLDDIHYCE